MTLRFTVLAICLLLAACASRGAQDTRPPLRVTATLVGFTENAAWSDFVDGTHTVEHASRFRVLAPAELCGTPLEVLHDALPDPASPWRTIGATWEIDVMPERADALRAAAAGRGRHDEFHGAAWTRLVAEASPSSDPERGCPSAPSNADPH